MIATPETRIPDRVARLPKDRLGRPVPWFVAWFDEAGRPAPRGEGQPDFRIVAAGKMQRAVADRVCWMCGSKLTRHGTFVIGPMCAVNRTTAEPPCHFDCALYAATHCPFLTNPRMRRHEKDKPAEAQNPAGEMITRNPGVVLLWITRDWRLFGDGRGGELFRLGDPAETHWLREGRPATFEEAWASIESGLPILRDMAEKERDMAGALAQLESQVEAALPYLPEQAA